MSDHMQTGELIGLPDGWYLEVATGRRFRMTDAGVLVDEQGRVVKEKGADDDDGA